MTTAEGVCVHRWRIESPHDGLHRLAGACLKCGATRNDFVAGGIDHEAASWRELGEHYRRGQQFGRAKDD